LDQKNTLESPLNYLNLNLGIDGFTTSEVIWLDCFVFSFEGHDCIGIAKTGSGKTAAFALPILQKLSKDPYGIFALVLTPTR
jgi:ATP-dependent RNA helicase DDX49/DBP8